MPSYKFNEQVCSNGSIFQKLFFNHFPVLG